MPSKPAKNTPPAPPVVAVPRVAVVVSRYNRTVTDRLLQGAILRYAKAGGAAEHVSIVHAPGAFELPALCLAAARSGRFAGVVALGCVIKGETSHDRYISDAVAHGLVGITIATGIPVGFGVLTVDTPEQAIARAGGKHGNKGDEAMSAVLDTIAAINQLRSPPKRNGGSTNRASSGGAPARILPDKAKPSAGKRSKGKA